MQTKSPKLLTFLILQRKRRKGKDWNRQGFCECRNENIFGDHQQEHRTKPRRERQPLRLLGRGQIRRRGLSVRLGRQPTHACHRAELRQTIRQRGALRGQMQWRIESTLPHRMSKTCRLRIRTFPRKFAAFRALCARCAYFLSLLAETLLLSLRPRCFDAFCNMQTKFCRIHE